MSNYNSYIQWGTGLGGCLVDEQSCLGQKVSGDGFIACLPIFTTTSTAAQTISPLSQTQ
jgi:hypothetical protein